MTWEMVQQLFCVMDFQTIRAFVLCRCCSDAETLLRFGLIWGPFPLLVSVVVIEGMWRDGIDRAKHEDTQKQLAQLKISAEGKPVLTS